MAHTWDQEININTDWNGDTSTGGLPVKGSRVQEFIRNQIRSLISTTGSKFGKVSYEGGVIRFYDYDGGQQLDQITLSGTSYVIAVASNRSSNFNVLTDDTTTQITFTPSTTAYEVGQSEGVAYPEDYTFTLEVDTGSGYVDRTPQVHTITSGSSGTVDVRTYLKTGANRIRIIVTGVSSTTTRTSVWTANLTSLSLSCSHTWERAWISGQTYSINGIHFAGNIQKTLHVKIGSTEYTHTFSSSEQAVSSAYEFPVTSYFPSGGTGIYAVEVWMTGDGVETSHTTFNLMCVAAAESATAKLTVLNDVIDEAVNFASNDLFKYATYNRTAAVLTLEANIGSTQITLVDAQSMSVTTQTQYTYTTTLTIDTEETDDLSLSIDLDSQTATSPIDNSAAYLATTGATFYMQPAIRYNTTSDKLEWHNSATGATTTTYAATWSGMTWSTTDGWNTDSDGNKTLTLAAGSTCSVPNLRPLATASASSETIEFMYSSSTVADYDTPVMTLIDNSTYSSSTSKGIVLFPTKLLVLTSSERSQLYQSIDLDEDTITHIAIVLKRDAYGIGHNLCSIYVNGVENVTFEYSGTSTFGGDAGLKLGQASSDFHLYMMRCYTKALESNEVFNNYLNAMIDTTTRSKSGLRADNQILDGGAVSYDLVKRAGFNCLVYETDGNLPDLRHSESSSMKVNLRVEYAAHPEWNVTIKEIPIDGQGTTSMRYYRWNLRNKIKDSTTVWEYPNYTEGGVTGKTETGKAGYIAGYGLHPTVAKITAKKNVASSPQGHKMGATGIYNDLWQIVETTSAIPEDCRVATYQYPMLAFQMYSDGTYEYKGLMTFGPDKTDKNTFGFGETEDYPSLMMIEGPNHSPMMTRFLVPWTSEVTYDYANETLSYGGQEGWDADIAADYSTDSASDAAAILNLYTTEFKPAYDAIYYTSPYIASLTESGKTLAEINADVTAFRALTTRGYSNELMTFYDSNYQLVYFSYAQQQYLTLPLTTHNMLTYLSLTGSPTTAQILAARQTKFNNTVWNYVSKSEAVFHYVFCELFAVTDNFAKNSYWRKFDTLADGGKWGFNQDDLDTIFATDNNGQDTKAYYVEPQDTNATTGAEVFQGVTSAFWTSVRMWCETEIADKYREVWEGLKTLAAQYSVSGDTEHESVLNVISYYFHSNSARYFPATAYNSDTEFTYEDVWALDPDATYNAVPPLTQVHGDHYDTEMAWIKKRISYIGSKYKLYGWTEDDDDGLGQLEFTPASAFTMQIKPAINMYPRYSNGGATSEASTRTSAGSVYQMSLPGSSNTTMYIKGADLLTDVGDLHNFVLSNRSSVSSDIPFSIKGARLRRVLCGNDTAANVTFNATKMTIEGDAIESVNLKNCSTITNNLSLLKCPRLSTIDVSGTNIPQVLPAVGGRVTSLVLPAAANTVFLHSLNLLTSSGLTLPTLTNIQSLYINGMPNLDVVQMLNDIMDTANNTLKYVTLLWSGTSTITSASDLASFTYLANHIYDTETGEGYGRVTWNGSQLSNVGEKPDLQGNLTISTNAFREDITSLQTTFPNVTFVMTGDYYQSFEDEEVLDIAADTWGDGTGVTENTWQNTALNWSTQPFKGNTNIEEFNEMGDMTVTPLNFGENYDPNDGNGQFNGCTSLTEVTLPNCRFNGGTLFNQTGIVTVHSKTNSRPTNAYSMFRKCYNLTSIPYIDFSECDSIRNFCYLDAALTTLEAGITFPEVTDALDAFNGCTSLTSLPAGFTLPVATNTSNMFDGCTSLTSLPSGFTLPVATNTSNMFYGCTSITSLPDGFTLPKVTSAQNMFRGCLFTTLPAGFSIPELTYAYNMFGNCTSLTTLPAGFTAPKVTNAYEMFDGCTALTSLPSGFSIPVATNVNYMFNGCTALTSLPSGFSMSAATSTQYMFRNCTSLTNISGLTGLKRDVSLAWSSLLTPLSVHNIITTAAGGTSDANITITLHATAKANWQASEYYTADAAMAASKYITIA